MKKGFTLVELLGIIVILSLIAAIAYPIVVGNINSAKNSADKSQTDFIIEAAKYWANDHSNLLSDTEGEVYVLELSTLKEAGYFENSTYQDLKNGQYITNGCVKITTEAHRYTYSFEKQCEQ